MTMTGNESDARSDDETAVQSNRGGSVNRTNPYARSTAKSKRIQNQANSQNKKAKTDTDAQTDPNDPTVAQQGQDVTMAEVTDPLKKSLQRSLERMNSNRKTVVTVKLRFKPELKYKHYGDTTLRDIENPIIGHLRKFMRQCSDVTGDTAVFRTFTSNKEFDYKHCLKTDAEAEKELLAEKQTQGKFTHVMMLRIVLVSNPHRFKSYLGVWLRNNHTILLDHPYPKKEVETVRIGFIHSKHPTDTYRTDYQEELNIKLNAEVNRLGKIKRMKVILEETGDVDGNIPQIRVINQYISWGRGERRTETRGLVIECLKVDRQYVLRRIPSIFETTQFRFVPFSLAYDRNVEDSATQYHNLLKSHKEHIKTLYTFSILGLKEDEMLKVTPEEPSIKEQLLLGDVILGVEKTPGTYRSGKWNLITTKSQRIEAEKYFDGLMVQKFGDIPRAAGEKVPYRVQVSQVPIEYIDEVLVTERLSSQDTATSTLTSAAASKLKNKMEGMLSKCETTMSFCKNTMETMESNNKKGIQSMQEDWRKERNEFKNFLTTMSEQNDKKFSEIYEFQNQQELINDLVETDLDELRSEVSKLKERMTQAEESTEEIQDLLEAEDSKKPAFTEDDEDSMELASHHNPQGEPEDMRTPKRLRKKTRPLREHSRRYGLAKKTTRSTRRKKVISQGDTEDEEDVPRVIRGRKKLE